MKISKAEQAALIEDLRAIAIRLSVAPANTEEQARGYCARHPSTDPYMTHHPYQAGALEQICTSSARDLEAIIRRLGGGS